MAKYIFIYGTVQDINTTSQTTSLRRTLLLPEGTLGCRNDGELRHDPCSSAEAIDCFPVALRDARRSRINTATSFLSLLAAPQLTTKTPTTTTSTTTTTTTESRNHRHSRRTRFLLLRIIMSSHRYIFGSRSRPSRALIVAVLAVATVISVRADEEDANSPSAALPACLDIDTSNVEVLREPCKDPALACSHDSGCVCVPSSPLPRESTVFSSTIIGDYPFLCALF